MISLQKLKDLASGLAKSKIQVNESFIQKNVGVIPYNVNAKFEVIRALQKLNFRPWNLNPRVLLSRGSYPVTVTDSMVFLLGADVPRWADIEKTLIPLTNSRKLDFKVNALGILTFTSDDVKKVKSALKIRGSESPLYDVKLESSGASFNLFRPLDLDFNVKTPAKPASALEKPRKERNAEVRKFELSEPLLDLLDRSTEKNSRTAMLLVMKQIWRELNKAKFNSQLKEPAFGLMRNMGSSMRVRGRWWPRKKLLEMSPRAFNAESEVFLEVFLHEMCHQATSDISEVYGEAEGGHGPVWKSWMVKVGLNPNRYDRRGNDDYEDPKTRQVRRYVDAHAIDRSEIKVGLQCGIYSSGENVIKECVVIVKEPHQVRVITGRGENLGFKLDPTRYSIPLVWLPKYRWDVSTSNLVPDEVKQKVVKADKTYT